MIKHLQLLAFIPPSIPIRWDRYHRSYCGTISSSLAFRVVKCQASERVLGIPVSLDVGSERSQALVVSVDCGSLEHHMQPALYGGARRIVWSRRSLAPDQVDPIARYALCRTSKSGVGRIRSTVRNPRTR